MANPVWIKICGVTSLADALAAARLGADAVGLNFYPPSPRFVDLDMATAILGALPSSVEAVGVVVNEPLAAVAERLQPLPRLRTIQFHGDQPEINAPSSFQRIVAFAVRGGEGLKDITRYLERCRDHGALPRAILVDAHVAGLHGGTGRTAPWELLEAFRPGVPLILAGGLTPENVAEAVRRVRPDGVDVASGVEASPGRKDFEKMGRFVNAVREAGGDS
jgi:phosphoribosylanthranilate isomerase